MPVRFEIDKERRLVRSFGWGDLTFADLRQHQQTLRADPDFDPDFDQLGDLSGVVSVAISAHEVEQVAYSDLFSANSHRAFVASSQLAYGLLRMFQAHHEFSSAPSKTMVFTNMSEALDWLDKKD